MKRTRITISFIAFIVLLKMTGCQSDDLPTQTAQDLAFEKLAGAWTLGTAGSIEVDGQDISLNFPDFSLSFTDGGYTTSNAGQLFRASGTWDWTDEEAGELMLDDGKELTIINLTENVFNFSFNFSGVGGTANGVAGDYEITVVK